MMFSNGLNWVGRFSFFAGILLGAIVLIGQCLYWLKDSRVAFCVI
jgi:hypothetical protein